jgi:hypothetical protein
MQKDGISASPIASPDRGMCLFTVSESEGGNIFTLRADTNSPNRWRFVKIRYTEKSHGLSSLKDEAAR